MTVGRLLAQDEVICVPDRPLRVGPVRCSKRLVVSLAGFLEELPELPFDITSVHNRIPIPVTGEPI